mgnify:CR=1 FL=1
MVYFVGAGCGAPDLITVRGKNLLEQADVIIYAGSLVNPELLGYARKDAKWAKLSPVTATAYSALTFCVSMIF